MLEFWKRNEAKLAMRWGMSNFEEVRKPCLLTRTFRDVGEKCLREGVPLAYFLSSFPFHFIFL